MGDGQAKLARRYAKQVCQTWESFREDAQKRCDRKPPPAWCHDESALSKRPDLQGYFATLTAGVGSARSPLERDNVMDLVTSNLSAQVLTLASKQTAQSWAAGAVAAYLERASAGEAVALANRLKRTWVGLAPSVMTAFEAYLDGPTALDAGQRRALRRALGQPEP
jgi:hypothetical protein